MLVQRCVLQSRFHPLLYWPSVLQTGSARRVGEMIRAIKLLSTEPITWKFSEHIHPAAGERSEIRHFRTWQRELTGEHNDFTEQVPVWIVIRVT